MASTLLTKYTKEIVPALKAEFSLANNFQVPRLVKIVVNTGLGIALTDPKIHEQAKKAIAQITGQMPLKTLSRKSVAGFKLREGVAIGQKVTLRGERMYDFFEKFVQVALPRVRDFRGIQSKSIDPNGNLSIGLAEQTIFPEIKVEEVERPIPLSVTIVTSGTKNRDLARKLYEKFGIPFSKE